MADYYTQPFGIQDPTALNYSNTATQTPMAGGNPYEIGSFAAPANNTLSNGASGTNVSTPNFSSGGGSGGSYNTPVWQNTPMGYGGVGYGGATSFGINASPIYLPGANPGARQLQAQYANAYNAASQANNQRYNTIMGSGSGAVMGQIQNGGNQQLNAKGQLVSGGGSTTPVVNIGGKWIPRDQVSSAQLQGQVAQNSQWQPANGGYTGLYGRAMTDVNNMQNTIGGFYGDRTTQGMGLINGMNGVASQYGDRTNTGMDYINQLKPIEDQYNQRTQTSQGNLAQGLGDVGNAYNQRTQQSTAQLGGSLADVVNQYNARTGTGMNMVNQLGAQQKNDLNRSYDNQTQGELADLSQRGLGNSTVASSVQQSVQADRAQAMGRLNDSLNAQRLNTYGQLSGQALDYAGRVPTELNQNYNNLSGQALQYQGQIPGQLNQNYNNLTGQSLQFASEVPQLQAQNYSNLSGQALNYAGQIPEQQAQNYSNLSGQQGQNMQQLGQLGLQTDQGVSKDMLDAMERVNTPYPNQQAYQQAQQSQANYGLQQQYMQLLQQQLQRGGGY